MAPLVLVIGLISHFFQVADSGLSTKELAKQLQPYYRHMAEQYEFSFETEEPPLQLRKQPIMSWTGEESGLVSGDVFVWTSEGRAEVIGCVGSLPATASRRGVFHEFHTLSAEKKLKSVDLIASGRKWNPKEGREPTEIEGVSKPSRNASVRMAQMRSLARQFRPRMRVQLQGVEAAERGEDGGFDNLRLLNEPLYRFDVKKLAEHPSTVDGAIFCYVWTRGTDPELLILIEARKDKQGEMKWFYTPVRFTFRELWLNYKGKEVWHHEGGNGRTTYEEPYITDWQGNVSMESIRAVAK